MALTGLHDATDLSLRALYQGHGSEEQMVVAVLRHRIERYLAHLAGSTGLHDLFRRAQEGAEGENPLSWLFQQALVDHPADLSLSQAIVDYHTALHSRLLRVVRAEGLPDEAVDDVIMLHEGMVAAAPAVGREAALRVALAAADRLLADCDLRCSTSA